MNLNFNFNRKEITSEEIASKMNFREVLSNYKILTKPFYKTTWFASTVGLTIIGITTLVVMNTTNVTKDNTNQNSTKAIDKTSTYKEDSPCVNPPIKEADIPFTSYNINSDTGGEIIHSSGSKITIPKGVFVVDGKKVIGNVEIRYREFRDQADFILSGIPMTYDSAGTKYHFESAGMIEIRAFQNNEPVDLNGEIDVNMKSDYASTKYNLYALNEKENNWECIGKDKVSETKEVKGENILSFNDTKNEIKNTELKLEVVKKEIVEIKNKKPEEPIKRNFNNYAISLDVLADEFPELATFSTQKFEVDANEKGFDPKFYDTEWEDIKIIKDKRTGILKMIVTKNYRDKSFAIYPVFEGKNYTAKKAAFDEAFDLYEFKLEQKLEEEKQLAKKLETLRANTNKKSKEIANEWKEKRNMSEEPITSPSESGIDARYYSKADKVMDNSRMVGGFLMTENFQYDRKFKVPNLGVFNCDHAVASLPIAKKGDKHRLKFFNKVGEALILGKIFVLEKARNVMFTYVGEDMEKIRINQNDENMIVGICTDGKIAVFNRTDFKFLDLKQDILELKLQVFDTVKDVAELREIIQS